ncbi:PQ-loop domain-containing transporter [Mycoplasma todarodis]|uniref:PQ-loop domain-containing transporter n=1 Tax=Mycoplasma todarodis TaxID=1937191 RepID=UPI003B334E65
MDNLLIILIIGMIILDASFLFQIVKIWTEKHSFGLSLTSWTVNMIGRIIWIVYGMLLSNHGGIVLTIGQGLCGLMTIPVIYYILRNRKTDGEYKKEHFSKPLFALRVFMVAIIFTLIVTCIAFSILAINEKDKIGEDKMILVISLIGSSFTGLSFLPQAIKTVKTQDTKATSLNLCLAFILGNSLMITYLMIQAVNDDVMKYIAGIIFTSISVLSMITITIIKIKNIITLKQNID